MIGVDRIYQSPVAWQVFVCVLVLTVSAVLVGRMASGWSTRERRVVTAGFGLHAAASFGLLLVTIYVYDGVGDVFSYFREGQMLARYIKAGPSTALEEVISLIFHGRPVIPVYVTGLGSPTGAASGVGGLLMWALDSMWAGNLLIAMLAFSGLLAIHAGIRDWIEPALRRYALVGLTLIPSVAFWGGGLLKETLAIFGLGWFLRGLCDLQERRYLRAAVEISGLVPVLLFKPYLAISALAGLVTWWFSQRSKDRTGTVRIRALPVAIAAAGFLVGMASLGSLFPQYALGEIGDAVADERMHALAAAGGSATAGPGGGGVGARSLVGQIVVAPLAIVTAMFRPFVFEVRNAAMLVSAAEVLVFTILFGRGLYRWGVRGAWAKVKNSPLLLFALAFTLLTAAGVGLANVNLGTISRYRIPMMPFFAFLLLALNLPSRRVELSPAERPT